MQYPDRLSILNHASNLAKFRDFKHRIADSCRSSENVIITLTSEWQILQNITQNLL